MNTIMLVFIITAGSQDVWDVIVVLAILMDKKAMQIVQLNCAKHWEKQRL